MQSRERPLVETVPEISSHAVSLGVPVRAAGEVGVQLEVDLGEFRLRRLPLRVAERSLTPDAVAIACNRRVCSALGFTDRALAVDGCAVAGDGIGGGTLGFTQRAFTFDGSAVAGDSAEGGTLGFTQRAFTFDGSAIAGDSAKGGTLGFAQRAFTLDGCTIAGDSAEGGTLGFTQRAFTFDGSAIAGGSLDCAGRNDEPVTNRQPIEQRRDCRRERCASTPSDIVAASLRIAGVVSRYVKARRGVRCGRACDQIDRLVIAVAARLVVGLKVGRVGVVVVVPDEPRAVPSELRDVGRVVDAQLAIERGVSTAAVGVGVEGRCAAYFEKRREVHRYTGVVPIA